MNRGYPDQRPQQQPPIVKQIVMDENWKPGDPILIPDPSDPTGQRKIEIPPD